MRKFRIKKLNNQGSTFVLALLVITLLTTLSLALANASISNMTMKSVDRGSKKAFYTSETLLDEVRAGVGYSSLDNLAYAYEKVLTNLVTTSGSTLKVVNNDVANKNLKENYITNVLKTVSGGFLAFDSGESVTSETKSSFEVKKIKESATNYIQGFIKGSNYTTDMAKVTSVGHVRAYKDSNEGYKWIVIVEDVAISFKEQKGDEIVFSNITADLEIEYPNMTVDFTTTNRLTDFLEYSLIADNSLVISGQKANFNASVYAGDLIDISPSQVDTTKGAVVNFQSLADNNINVVCGGDSNATSGTIRVGGNTQVASEAHFKGANIWCTNIATRRDFAGGSQDATAGAIITIDNDCISYVKDDLSVDAQKSNITVAGEYYGYKYDGANNSLGHAASSAIIVNGRNSNVSIKTSKLLLAGRAYIDITGDANTAFMTGESLGLKGDQDIYLIPTKFLGIGYSTTITNPMPLDIWTDLFNKSKSNPNIKVCQLPADYFAKPYLNTSIPYITKQVGDMVYLYWNFATTNSNNELDLTNATKFVKDVMAGKDSEIKGKIDRYTKNLFGGMGAGVTVHSDSSTIYSTGVLMEATAGAPGYTASTGSMAEAAYALKAQDLENRYIILIRLLVSIPWNNGAYANTVTNKENALAQYKGFEATGDELNRQAIIENLVDTTLIRGNEYNPNSNPIVYGPPTENYTKVAVDGNYVVPDDIDGGVIIATGSVTLNHDFHGLILAGGNINITGDATITTSQNMVEDFILSKEEFKDPDINSEDIPFKQYFYAYKVGALTADSRENVKIENVDYKDLVNFNNWRKYEDK